MGWFFLYWIVGIIICAVGWYKLLSDELTVGHLFACIAAGIFWPVISLLVLYVEYKDVVIFKKKMKDSKKKMLRDFGFDEQMDNVDEGRCATCGSFKVKYNDFKDSLSWKEFKISHMCQECQDQTFG